jgi:hypothetical protein
MDVLLPARVTRAGAARLLGSAVAAVLVFVAATGRGIPVTAAIGALVVVLLAELAYRRPAAAMCAALLAISFVPVYWGRPIVGRTIVGVPATVAAIVLLPVALPQLRRWRLQSLDVWYGLFIAALALAALLNVPKGLTASSGILWRFALPYVVWRLATLRWLNWPAILRIFVAGGTALGAFALEERSTGKNSFFTWVTPNYQADQWAHSTFRNGALRAEASFGEPISFGLFLAVCIVLAVTVIVTSHRLLEQIVVLGATAVMTVAVFDTMSRIAIAVAIAGVGWQLVRLVHTDRLKRLVAVLAISVVAVIATPIGRSVIDAANSTSGQTRTAQSAQYRLRVLDVLQDPKEYSVLGHPGDQAESVSALARSETGLKSLDSEYAVALITGGVIALLALLGLGLTLLYGAVTPAETDPNVRAVLTATAAVMCGLAVVALLTQFADIFGILIALLASQRQRRAATSGVGR